MHNQDYVRITSSLIPGIATVIAWMLVMAGQSSDGQGDVVVDDKPQEKRPLLNKKRKGTKPAANLNISMQEVL